MNREYLNLILLSVAIVVMICVCMLHVIYKTLGCRCSWWLHGIRIKYNKNQDNKNQSKCCSSYTVLIQDNGHPQVQFQNNGCISDDGITEEATDEDSSVVVNNVETLCCLHFSWIRTDEEKNVITLPEAQQIQYGKVTSHNSLCKELLATCWRFPSRSKNETCPICLDTFVDGCSLILLRCCHAYHEECVASWLQSASKSKVSCPMCKKDMYADGFQEKTPLTISSFSHTTSSTYTSYLGYSRMIAAHV